MSIGSRVSMPSEFYDKSDDNLLIQPIPQFLYADFFLNAMAASLTVPSDLGLPGRSISGQGADYQDPVQRDQLRLSNPITQDLMQVKIDFNGAPGNTIRINRPAYATSTYTEVSRRVASGQTISTTPITPLGEQNNLTLYRYGGPYSNAQSSVAPLAIERFDAEMGVHNLVKIIGNTLVFDFRKFIDAVINSLLDLASTTIYPEGMSADNDATTAGSFPFTYEQLLRTERTADDNNLPVFADGFRIAVLPPLFCEQLGIDPLYARASQFHPLYNNLFPQYVKSVSKTHIFKSTTLSSVANSSSVNIHRGHYMGPGPLMGGMGARPQVWDSTNDNYGQSALVVWLADLAFGLADNRLVLSVRASQDASGS